MTGTLGWSSASMCCFVVCFISWLVGIFYQAQHSRAWYNDDTIVTYGTHLIICFVFWVMCALTHINLTILILCPLSLMPLGVSSLLAATSK